MLGKRDVVASVAVKDLEIARKFYADTLGMTQEGGDGEEMMLFRSGASTFNVYRSEYAGSNKATALTWSVGADIEDVVEALKAKGITFEHYDMPDTTREGDIHIMGDFKGVWFKDPDGNLLNVINM